MTLIAGAEDLGQMQLVNRVVRSYIVEALPHQYHSLEDDPLPNWQ